MRPENYIQQAVQLESCDFKAIASRLSNIETIRLLHAAIGIETEAGEFLDAMKKHIFYDRAPDLVNLKEEIGDLLWYIALALHTLGYSFEEVMAVNIAKLRLRYPDKFTAYDATHRDLGAERAVLEEGSGPK